MKHILLVEDEEAIRRYLTVLLEKNDYLITAVVNGREALELLKQATAGPSVPYDLLITDVEMPIMGGFELLDEIKKLNIYLPSVIITGANDRSVVLDALRHGCHEFIDKPLVVNDVLRKVQSTFTKIEKSFDLKQKGQEYLARTQSVKRMDMHDDLKMPPGRTIAKYNIIKVIGEGGVGTVFLCENMEDKQQYALKTLRLRSAGTDRESSIRRFINESNAISQLNHPNIVNFIEFGYSGTGNARMPYIVMEYFEGQSLKKYLEDPESLTLVQKISIITQIAQGLQAAHSKNIFHRDIKPDNILVDKELRVKITDFGICYLPTSDITRTSELMGSPGYMAPEYLQHGKTDKLMDIYALGVVAYELMIGVRPFDANNLTELMSKIIKKNPAEPRKLVPDFPEDLQDILAKMLRKNPKRRYQSAAEVIDELNLLNFKNTDTHKFKFFRNVLNKDWN